MNFLRFENPIMDKIDREILVSLSENARITTASLAKRVGLSPPSTAERIRRLEEKGVIDGYTLKLRPEALGRGLAAWIRIRPTPGKYEKVADIIRGTDEIIHCDRITGDDCFIAKVLVHDMSDIERIVDALVPFAVTNTSIVQSSPVEARLPPLTHVR